MSIGHRAVIEWLRVWGHDWSDWEDKSVDLQTSYDEYGGKKTHYQVEVQDSVCAKCHKRRRRKVRC